MIMDTFKRICIGNQNEEILERLKSQQEILKIKYSSIFKLALFLTMECYSVMNDLTYDTYRQHDLQILATKRCT